MRATLPKLARCFDAVELRCIAKSIRIQIRICSGFACTPFCRLLASMTCGNLWPAPGLPAAFDYQSSHRQREWWSIVLIMAVIPPIVEIVQTDTACYHNRGRAVDERGVSLVVTLCSYLAVQSRPSQHYWPLTHVFPSVASAFHLAGLMLCQFLTQ